MVIGDVREALPRTGFRAPYDAVVLDIALDQHSPARLFQAAFIEELSALTAPDGVVLINVGDDAGLPACRRLVRVCLGLGLSVFATAPADVLAGDYTGNVILALSRRPWDAETLAAVRSSGPQPAGLVTGEALRQLLT